jgi:hypothetical protein
MALGGSQHRAEQQKHNFASFRHLSSSPVLTDTFTPAVVLLIDMANPKLNSIDEYEAFLTEKMTLWSIRSIPGQRTLTGRFGGFESTIFQMSSCTA